MKLYCVKSSFLGLSYNRTNTNENNRNQEPSSLLFCCFVFQNFGIWLLFCFSKFWDLVIEPTLLVVNIVLRNITLITKFQRPPNGANETILCTMHQIYFGCPSISKLIRYFSIVCGMPIPNNIKFYEHATNDKYMR